MTLMIQINTGVWVNVEHIASVRRNGTRVIVCLVTGAEYDAHVPSIVNSDVETALAALVRKINESAEIIRRGPPPPPNNFRPHSQD